LDLRSWELLLARLTITNKAGVALTFEASNSIGTRCVVAAVISTRGAFVNINANLSISLVTGLAGAAAERARRVGTIRIGTAIGQAFIDVSAYTAISSEAVVAFAGVGSWRVGACGM
jgi:nicotinamide mononucleotide (NMN) deamidase PncC